MKKEYVIPVFVPHLGCPNDCVFCNQKSISGQKKNITKEDARKTIDYFLENIKDKEGEKEIAFFGGSFTGIDEKIQNELLELANEYIKKGQVSSIRISTRPDYINKEILKRLKKYKVKTIEKISKKVFTNDSVCGIIFLGKVVNKWKQKTLRQEATTMATQLKAISMLN